MALDARPAGGPGLKFKAATVGHLQASGVRLLSRPGANGRRTVYDMYNDRKIVLSDRELEIIRRVQVCSCSYRSYSPI